MRANAWWRITDNEKAKQDARLLIREPRMRMHMTSSENKLHVRPQDRHYHEEIGLRMASVFFALYKRQKTYHYGEVSYLKLLDEGKLPPDPGAMVQRDLDIYRQATREYVRAAGDA